MKACPIAMTLALSAAAASVTNASPIDVALNTPTLDRWVYTFNQNAGAELEATVFSVLGSGFEGPGPGPGGATFDVRDGQFLVGYNTAALVATGQPAANYRILSASVTARISRDKVFLYDATFDAMGTYLPATDPQFVADGDVGRPIELYMVGYRNGLSAATFAENTPFAFGNPTVKRVRNAYAAQFTAPGNGVLVDVSNNVQDLTASGGPGQFEARPLSIGTCPLAPGAEVDAATDFTFAIDLSNADAIRYLRESLAGGRVNLMISSMAPTAQQSSVTPAFFTREYPAGVNGAAAARLSMRVCVSNPADWNCSGPPSEVSVQDIFDYLADYFVSAGDFNADGATSVQDIFDFLAAYFAA